MYKTSHICTLNYVILKVSGLRENNLQIKKIYIKKSKNNSWTMFGKSINQGYIINMI